MHDALADEPVVPMAGPLYKTESHPFKKMTVK